MLNMATRGNKSNDYEHKHNHINFDNLNDNEGSENNSYLSMKKLKMVQKWY